MTSDAELCRACAEALGWTFVPDGNIPSGWQAAQYKRDGQLMEWECRWNPLDNPAQAELVEWALIEAGCEIHMSRLGRMGIFDPYDVVLADRDLTCPADKRRLLCEALVKLKEGTKNG